MNGIEDHLIKLDVKINHSGTTLSDSRKAIKFGNVDMDELKQFELPSESEYALANLDIKLKKDFEFKTKLVSNSNSIQF